MQIAIKQIVISSFLSLFTLVLLSTRFKIDEDNHSRYAEKWVKIDSLERKGLYRMALEEVNNVFIDAVEHKAHDHVIKSVIYELKYNSYLEEEDYVLGINKLNDVISETPSPSKEILHSLLAEVYWGYYNSNSWKFSNRTSVIDVDLKDIRTWDLKRIVSKVKWHYKRSLMNSAISQNIDLKDFGQIIINAGEEKHRNLRPTLFDFLGHRALTFFKTTAFSLPGPAQTFEIENADFFAGNTTFLDLNIATKDSLNTQFLSSQVMHLLTRFHFRKGNLEPLFQLELERLIFAREKSVHPDKEEKYRKGLMRMTETYKGNKVVSEAWYHIARLYVAQGENYLRSTDTTAKYKRRMAYEICEKTIAQYPVAFGSDLCRALINELDQKKITLSGEKVIIPNQTAKVRLEHQNIDEVHVKVVSYDYQKIIKNGYNKKTIKELKRKKGVQEDKIALKVIKDLNLHSTELPIDSLEPGFYVLLISSSSNFSDDREGFAYLPFFVSDITYQHRKSNNASQIIVSSRLTGKPKVGATVKVFESKYNYSIGRYQRKEVGRFKTNEKGSVSFNQTTNYGNYEIEITSGSDEYNSEESIYNYSNNSNEYDHITTTFYTDRKIYRPGQTIYFKGISVRYKDKKRTLVKSNHSRVAFYDVNGQEVQTVSIKTNAYGSFEGKFTAPFGALNGQMRISNGTGSTSFRVEEYKRPKFSIEINPIIEEFQVNDTIHATGFAQAFAGNRIDGATVKYRVVRSTRRNNYYWWRWYEPSVPKEITHGTLMTDENGEFNVKFNALPDRAVNPKELPEFNYTVYVDVIDINGETHSTSKSISVGYQSLKLGQNLTTEMNNENDFFLRLQTTNLNGQKITAKGKISVEQLKVPNQAFYERHWEKPDLQNWSQDEFQRLFSHEAYKNENQKHLWKTEKTVFESIFNTAETDSIGIPEYKNWTPGIYRYEAQAADKNGIIVKDAFYFAVYNQNAKKIPSNDVLWIKPIQSSTEVGEEIDILVGTIEKELFLRMDVEANGKLIESREILLSNEQKHLKYSIKEAYRGNISFHFTTIKNNRNFAKSFTINVPYTNKKLDINFETFRNKLLPGEKEEWILTIKNKYNEKEQAELLATLYDASLDPLYTPNSFFLNIYQTFYGRKAWSLPSGIGMSNASNIHYAWNKGSSWPSRYYPHLNYFGWSSYYYQNYQRNFFYDDYDVLENVVSEKKSLSLKDRKNKESRDEITFAESDEESESIEDQSSIGRFDKSKTTGKKQAPSKKLDNNSQENQNLEAIQARSNFKETAFFYPQLLSDENGTVKIRFTIPESLTKWRFLGLAHTQDLKIGRIEEEVVTQKELMIVPNTPRFLREGDEITIAAKISNLSEEELTGQAQLILYDPFTEEKIGEAFNLSKSNASFNVKKGESTVVDWKIKVPFTHSTVKYKIVAKAGNFSDGEENVLPILSNRMLVTESLPLPIRGEETKTFSFDKLKNSNQSTTLKHHRYTLEFTSNPAWYAIQAMPYMMEYPHECAEQTFTRYYSNAIATHIMNSSPKIKKIIEDWGENSPEAFLSNLQKNKELKAVILEETPWVLDAQNEENSKRNLAVLLDMKRMSFELDKALGKTIKTQSSSGGWPWFPGMRESRYITQHIVTGMGHLDHLGIKEIRSDRKVWNMIVKAVKYLDNQIVKDYNYAKEWDKDYLKNQHINYNQIQYLYARSYFSKIGMNKSTKEAVEYYKNQAVKFWLQFNVYAEGMIGLAAHRFGMDALAGDVVKSLKDGAIQNEELGMYWKEYQIGYYWYQAPIETQALMIELFDEVSDDQAVVDELKIWLLKQKQTTNWKTTKQTTEAVYALLLKGTDLLASDELTQITVGGKEISYVESDNDDPYKVNVQAGTGYFKTTWKPSDIKAEMGDVTVAKSSKGVAWGAAYWQYFEDLDKITFAETNLKLKKDLFLVDITDQGEQLKSINDENQLKVGEKIRVRIELRTDRNLEYVHMKDMRASSLEPIDILSSYRYQDGLGYYQTTKDVATNFFFDYIPKGTYVFEYDLRIQHEGNFSNGITTIQCMYAPEFTSHSEGIRINIVK